jgi:hypothetical protein
VEFPPFKFDGTSLASCSSREQTASVEEILIMRVLIIFAALVLLFALIGWITFSNDQGQSSINLETNEIREDTSEMMNKGSDLLKDAEQEVSPSTATTDDAATEPSTTR